MADHPPEDRIRQGEDDVKKADPHGTGTPRQQRERAGETPAAMPTDDRHATETAHSGTTEK
jgi:hypothetical protein